MQTLCIQGELWLVRKEASTTVQRLLAVRRDIPGDAVTKDPKRVAAGKMSKRKGNSNENALAKLFRDWWGHGEWARTPSSGGWATVQHREAFKTCGDILTTAADFIFCIEAKKQEGWVLDHLLYNPGNVLMKWWRQAEGETPRGLVTLLVATRNRTPALVIFDAYHMKITFPDAYGPMSMFPQFAYFHAGIPDPSLTVMPLSDFMSLSPDLFGRKMPHVEPAEDTSSSATTEVPKVHAASDALSVQGQRTEKVDG